MNEQVVPDVPTGVVGWQEQLRHFGVVLGQRLALLEADESCTVPASVSSWIGGIAEHAAALPDTGRAGPWADRPPAGYPSVQSATAGIAPALISLDQTATALVATINTQSDFMRNRAIGRLRMSFMHNREAIRAHLMTSTAPAGAGPT